MPSVSMKSAILLGFALPTILSAVLSAAETPPRALPFAPEVISRLSLDGRPRSLSIRQGADVWLGYDLERATPLKVWRAPAGKPGLIKSGFSTRSTGATWFEDRSDAAWELRRGESIVRLVVRYLGCSQRKDHIELRWELRCGDPQHGDTQYGEAQSGGVVRLVERVPLAAAAANEREMRELRVENLAAGESLLPPSSVRKSWKLAGEADQPYLTGQERHRFTLP
jgi:hypothetical protein